MSTNTPMTAILAAHSYYAVYSEPGADWSRDRRVQGWLNDLAQSFWRLYVNH